MKLLCKDKPCYLVQCHHCSIANTSDVGCQKTEEEQRKINLFVKNGHLMDKIDKEYSLRHPNMGIIQDLYKQLGEILR